MKLYKCETIAQFKIGMWLVEQGIEREDILTAELLGPNEVKITNPAGQSIHIRWMGDHAEIVRGGDQAVPRQVVRLRGEPL